MHFGGSATWRALRGAAFLLLAILGPNARAAAAPLHVPSPDWRDQIIYFLMTDRFDDGDPGNNDQGAGEFDPASNAKYSGGDLKGIERRLDYIRGLGANAIWITPPVANQWWDGHYGGYHGYWAENFMAVDAHEGSLDDYRRLSDRIHAAGMYLVQDIVVNHTGNFFSYAGSWDRADPAAHFQLHPDARGRSAPTQPPFDRNDARDPADRKAAIYHWTPKITDYENPDQQFNFQLADLDDLNTENPVVRDALRQSYGYWIREVGVDAFRVDTAFYVPPDFFADFLYSGDPRYPGIARVATRTGRHNFLAFGEGFGVEKPYSDVLERRIDRYMRDPHGKPLLPGMLNFPLYGTLTDVFARGRPTAELAYRIRSMMKLHAQPWLMPSFVDNHDVDRFLTGGSQAALKQSLLAIMTLPGIPTLYYGTEQGFTEQRGAMFKAGFGSAGKDHFDTGAPLYQFIRRATALRRGNRVFSRGRPAILRDNAAAAGVLAYRMTSGHDTAIVVFNSSDHEALLDNLETGLRSGTVLEGLFGIDATPPDAVIGAGGRLTMTLPARSGLVWKPTPRIAAVPTVSAAVTLDLLRDGNFGGDFEVHGIAKHVLECKLVVDGDLSAAQRLRPGPDGRWSAKVDTGSMIDPSIQHSLVVWSSQAVSASRSFRVARQWTVLADVSDPSGDDRGPNGRYRYPTDAGWSANRPLDIESVRVSGAGGALRIELRMHKLVAQWSPPNGFDHVAFTLFLQLPGAAGGIDVMPFQNARLPDGMRWNYRLRTHGWSNALFAAAGASARQDGTAVTPAASINVNQARNTVDFTLPASALGGLKSLSGVKLYATTWDYDGGYRALTPLAQPAAFSGGDGTIDPLIMDDTDVITLP